MSKSRRKRNKQTKKRAPETTYEAWIEASDGESNGNLAMKQGNYYFNHYYDWLCNIALQLFEWEGLPREIPFYELEKNLIYRGMTAVYFDKTMQKYVVLNGTYTDINLYNEPIKFQSANVKYKNSSFNLYVEANDLPNCGVLIRNQLNYKPLVSGLREYATRLANIKQVIEMNLNAHKHPIAIEASDYNLLSLQKAFDQLEQNAPVMFTRKDTKDGQGSILKDMKVLNLGAPYIIDKLQQQFREEWNEAMVYMGLNSLSVFKKERVNQTDSNANNEQYLATRNNYLMFREQGATRINEYFPKLNVSVKPRKFIVTNEYGDQFESGGESSAI